MVNELNKTYEDFYKIVADLRDYPQLYDETVSLFEIAKKIKHKIEDIDYYEKRKKNITVLKNALRDFDSLSLLFNTSKCTLLQACNMFNGHNYEVDDLFDFYYNDLLLTCYWEGDHLELKESLEIYDLAGDLIYYGDRSKLMEIIAQIDKEIKEDK